MEYRDRPFSTITGQLTREETMTASQRQAMIAFHRRMTKVFTGYGQHEKAKQAEEQAKRLEKHY